MQFRKKPVEVEAVRVKDALYWASEKRSEMPLWLKNAYERVEIIFGNNVVYIRTLEGEMVANENDWIICGVVGEIYPCKPDIFLKTYEAI